MADRMAGRVLNGRYELLGVLGGGGMALVYRARDRVLNRFVAVKLLREQYASDPTFLQRFTREAQAAGALSHPNIVSVYDVGQDGSDHYIVMEYVPGETLRDLIERQAPLPVDQAVEITAGILAALEYAHRNGLIHRDIKPGNVLITPQGTIKVVDFGIAKGATDLSLTGAGIALGTAAYLSPEQARGESARVQSDLYSVGVTLYEMLTGRTPFQSDTDVGMAYQHINEQPQPPRQLNPLIPPQLEAIILRALSKNPAGRFGSAAEMEQALRNYAAFGAQATVAVPLAPPRPAPAPAAMPPRPAAIAPARPVRAAAQTYRGGSGSSSCLTWILGLVALLLLLGGAVLAFNGLPGLGGAATATPDLGVSPSFVPPTPRQPTFPPSATPPPATATTAPTVGPTETPPPPTNTRPADTPVVLALVPDVTSRSLADAQAAAGSLGLTVNVTGQQHDANHPEGTIITQDPAPGTRVSAGSAINVVVSQGAPSAAMPNVINTDGKQAQDYLAGLGFKVTVQEEKSGSVPVGVVTRQDPDPGKQIRVGDPVTIWISVGDTVPVPDVIGDEQKDAMAAMTAAGLNPQVVMLKRSQLSGVSGRIQPGQVARTDPVAGTQVPRGSTVTLVVMAPE
jgi:eukaryotic-like serine/threonine-protein kinase